jgi:methylenetetrahydrofolate dehydrogenase (NADP+)/methenyltetrahydrofolate cyclohydrolase
LALPAKLIDGAAVAERIREELKGEVTRLKERGICPGLTVILVGDDPASAVYVGAKERMSLEIGINGRTIRLPSSTSEEELLRHLDELNADPTVHGILVQSPLPPQINAQSVIERINPLKDVDGFHPMNVGKMLIGERDGFLPCTPAGVQELLRVSGVETHGKECVIVGRSNIVGKPMAALMVQDGRDANCTVTICHRYTENLAQHTKRADILITAVGRPNLVTADMVKPGAVVIDVGINRIADPTRKSGTRLVGDVDFEGVREVASLITPVPGGVGPMTIAMLLKNTVQAAQRVAA